MYKRQVLCGIKVSAVCSFVSPQRTRVADGRTDRITIPNTALAIAASRGIKSFRLVHECIALSYAMTLKVLLKLGIYVLSLRVAVFMRQSYHHPHLTYRKKYGKKHIR